MATNSREWWSVRTPTEEELRELRILKNALCATEIKIESMPGPSVEWSAMADSGSSGSGEEVIRPIGYGRPKSVTAASTPPSTGSEFGDGVFHWSFEDKLNALLSEPADLPLEKIDEKPKETDGPLFKNPNPKKSDLDGEHENHPPTTESNSDICLSHKLPLDRWCTVCEVNICITCSLDRPHSSSPKHPIYDLTLVKAYYRGQKAMQTSTEMACVSGFLFVPTIYFANRGGPGIKKYFSWEMSNIRDGITSLQKIIDGIRLSVPDWPFEGLTLTHHVQQLYRRKDEHKVFASSEEEEMEIYHVMYRSVMKLLEELAFLTVENITEIFMNFTAYLMFQQYNAFQCLDSQVGNLQVPKKNEELSVLLDREKIVGEPGQSKTETIQQASIISYTNTSGTRPDVGSEGGVEAKQETMKPKKSLSVILRPEDFLAPYPHVLPSMRRTVYYLDFQLEDQLLGRVLIETLPGITPLMSANFAVLCTGDRGKTYRECRVFQCWNRESIITGDIDANNGSSGTSVINDELFFPDNSPLPADRGAVGMRRVPKNVRATRGKVSSQFRIVLTKQPQKTGIFGHVIAGLGIVDRISALDDGYGNPRKLVIISDCGRCD